MPSLTTTITSEQLNILLEKPAGTPPAGVVPNFQNPANHTTAVISISVICGIAVTTAVAIRMYTKILLIKSIACEDCKSQHKHLSHRRCTKSHQMQF